MAARVRSGMLGLGLALSLACVGPEPGERERAVDSAARPADSVDHTLEPAAAPADPPRAVPYLDEQGAALGEIPGAQVVRREDSLLVRFGDAAFFEDGSAAFGAGASERLRALAEALNRFPRSHVILKGHTDGASSEQAGQRLSEDRVARMRSVLIAEGVSPLRITAIGFGSRMPLSLEDTAEARERNRRIEIEIRPERHVLEGSAADRQTGG